MGTFVRDVPGLCLHALPPSARIAGTSPKPSLLLMSSSTLAWPKPSSSASCWDKAPERYPRAALRWHGRLCREVDVSLEEAQAVLAALALMATKQKSNAAFALADLMSRRGLERPCETLVAWAREA